MAAPIDRRKYLNPETVALLNSMSIRARLVVEGYIIGHHRSPYHGFSVEFAEHRSYGPGDEVKHIDWKLYGKTDRLYVKRYQEETNLRAHIILDTSKSMLYSSGKVSKLVYANTLAAALSYLMINQQDATGLAKFSERIDIFIPPKAKPDHLNLILTQLDDDNAGDDTQIGNVLHELADRIKKRGIVILISDLFDEPKNILNGLKHFRHQNQEVIVFHILDRKELDFDFNSRTKFSDMETGEEIITEPWHIRTSYQNLINQTIDNYKLSLGKNLIDYVPLYTDENFDTGITEYLIKRTRLY